MKTESEYQQLFLNNVHSHAHSGSQQISAEVADIANHYWVDMTSHLTSYFSHESRIYITENAAKMLKKKITEGKPAGEAWKEVIRDFLLHNYWNQSPQSKKPEVKKTEEQKIFWHLFKYGWALFQAMIVIKIAIYYFGIEGAAHPEQTNPVWVWVFFGISLLSLGAFAYRNRKDET